MSILPLCNLKKTFRSVFYSVTYHALTANFKIIPDFKVKVDVNIYRILGTFSKNSNLMCIPMVL